MALFKRGNLDDDLYFYKAFTVHVNQLTTHHPAQHALRNYKQLFIAVLLNQYKQCDCLFLLQLSSMASRNIHTRAVAQSFCNHFPRDSQLLSQLTCPCNLVGCYSTNQCCQNPLQ